MRHIKLLTLFCLFALSSQCLFAAKHSFSSSSSSSAECCHPCTLGTSVFSTTNSNQWYTLATQPYPMFIPLSINGNSGSKQGKIQVLPTGLKINESGNYFVNFSAVLTQSDPEKTPIIQVFLVKNGVFIPNDLSSIGSVVTLSTGFVNTSQASGILQNVKAGTTLSLVTANAGSPEPDEITVLAWGIHAFKIPCEQ